MIWFTSDKHCGHRNLVRAISTWTDKESCRNFSSVEEMDDVILNGINRFVNPCDRLYDLGDHAMGPKEHHQAYLDRIHCKNIIFIRGNHDSKTTVALFKETYTETMVCHDGYKFYLKHHALAIWPRMSEGVIHLYGHSHGKAEEYLDKAFPGRRSMDVGVDNAYRLFGEYRPFNLNEIIEIMKDRKGCVIDHH